MNQKIIYMHMTTFCWLRDKVGSYQTNIPTFYSGNDITFCGTQVIVNNNLSETVDEGTDWIFPDEPFIKYEKKDRDWCEYFGIGRKGRGFILGEIVSLGDPDFKIKFQRVFNQDKYKYWWR